jgi:hypothetical protein
MNLVITSSGIFIRISFERVLRNIQKNLLLTIQELTPNKRKIGLVAQLAVCKYCIKSHVYARAIFM